MAHENDARRMTGALFSISNLESIFEAVSHAPGAHPVTHEKRASLSYLRRSGSASESLSAFNIIDSDSDPDPDPEHIAFCFYFRSSPSCAPRAHPVTHEKRGFLSSLRRSGSASESLSAFNLIDSDSDPDSDPEHIAFCFYFRSRNPASSL